MMNSLKFIISIISSIVFVSIKKSKRTSFDNNNFQIEFTCGIDDKILCDNNIVAGGANPTRTIALIDNNGIEKYYPQALVKQLSFERYPEFGPFDISAKFNSEVNYWFEGNKLPIKSDQTDFILIVLHEFIHGLGFISRISFNGFVENIFDKYLIFLPSGEYASNIAVKINTIVNEKGKFKTSSQYQQSEMMLKIATSPFSLGFLP
ncbi:hypothetical protein GLOIN_2v1613585 [Rhizophagus clarus]|uniref:Sequence orphan n=1 Tax=Rhizophagus clarus TaxID=94130 RepID=A0A8H3R1I4_9GLOM|nr:hypothetical protein GLOIN_2v1613585 [Rhizophagus clarus]